MIMALFLIHIRKRRVRSVLVQENGGACLQFDCMVRGPAHTAPADGCYSAQCEAVREEKNVWW